MESMLRRAANVMRIGGFALAVMLSIVGIARGNVVPLAITVVVAMVLFTGRTQRDKP